jgi:hypothetical protein
VIRAVQAGQVSDHYYPASRPRLVPGPERDRAFDVRMPGLAARRAGSTAQVNAPAHATWAVSGSCSAVCEEGRELLADDDDVGLVTALGGCATLQMPMLTAFTMPMENRAFRAVVARCRCARARRQSDGGLAERPRRRYGGKLVISADVLRDVVASLSLVLGHVFARWHSLDQDAAG